MKPDPGNSRGIKRIGRDTGAGTINLPLWIDRARVFQSAMSRLTTDYGTADLSINDLTPEGAATGPAEPPPNYPTDKPKNYCERQGRCNIGCLPGASHTLNSKAAADGVVDEFGRVFDKTRTGERSYYEGLYLVDGSIIPTALGVNPSLTITALSLRAADRIIADHRERRP